MKLLKEHLLPRIHARLKVKASQLREADVSLMAQSNVILKDNRVYQHKLARFSHTTYDVRRSEDVINPRTPHCNIMLLSTNATSNKFLNCTDAAATIHPYLYGRVIGIYHVNVIYNGPGMTGYIPMRFDFLHVRWFQLQAVQSAGRGRSEGWASLRLDCLSFPPMADKGSFDFVDPTLVLRSCHLIPAFSLGKSYLDGIGLSRMSRDENDWKVYYVNRYVRLHPYFFLYLNHSRFADRDMVMRYH